MAAAIVQTCVDPRLNHELLRIQIRQKLDRLGLTADRIFILNDVGGNVGGNFRNTVAVLKQQGDPIVLCAVLHHDLCIAAGQGARAPIEESLQRMTGLLEADGIACHVLTGNVLTENNVLQWSDEPAREYQPFSFGGY